MKLTTGISICLGVIEFSSPPPQPGPPGREGDHVYRLKAVRYLKGIPDPRKYLGLTKTSYEEITVKESLSLSL